MISYKKNTTFLILFIISSFSYLFSAEFSYQILILDPNHTELENKILHLFQHPQISSCLSVSIDALLSRMRSKSYTVLFVQNEQNMVVAALVYYLSSNQQDVWVYTIAVHPDYQHKGIGKMLLKHLEEKFGNKRIRTSFLASNIKIHNLLKQLNYVQADYFIKLEKPVDIAAISQDIVSQKVVFEFLDRDNEQDVLEFCNLFQKEEVGFYGPDDIKKQIVYNKKMFLCAKFENTVVGGLIVTPNVKSCEPGIYGWELFILAIHPSYRRHGIASQLILFCQQQAAQAKVDRLLITVRQDNMPAYCCYKKLGFVEKDAISNMVL